MSNEYYDDIKIAAPLRAYGPDPADGSFYAATWANVKWQPGSQAVSHDLYLSTSFDEVNERLAEAFRGNQIATSIVVGFAGFAFPDGLVLGTTYYWRVDEVNDADPNSPWNGAVWSFSVPSKTAYLPDPPDGAEFVEPGATFGWTGGFGAMLHTVYIGSNFEDVNNASGGAQQGVATYTPTLEPEKVYYWRVDEFTLRLICRRQLFSSVALGSRPALNRQYVLDSSPLPVCGPAVLRARQYP